MGKAAALEQVLKLDREREKGVSAQTERREIALIGLVRHVHAASSTAASKLDRIVTIDDVCDTFLPEIGLSKFSQAFKDKHVNGWCSAVPTVQRGWHKPEEQA
jgi:hypothetical protein